MKKGFTLIELLGIIIILGIIATITIPFINKLIKESKEKTSNASTNALIRQSEAYYVEKKSEGVAFNGCELNFTNNTNSCNDFKFSGKKPEKGFLKIAANGTLSFALKLEKKCYMYYNQKDIEISDYNDETCKIDEPSNFSTDSWETIIVAAKSNNTTNYNVGDTKEINLGTFGTHTVRIANMSTPNECKAPGFSQTACGFVLEFTDIITLHRMNPYDENSQELGNGNIGDWEYTEMRSYLNNDIYNSFPEKLKNSIIDTYVISGLYSNNPNITSTNDKLYLLAFSELFLNQNNELKNYSRVLDYYSSHSTTWHIAQKQYNNSNTSWWLRIASPIKAAAAPKNFFEYIFTDGTTRPLGESTDEYGVSPAFRL